MKIGFVGLGSMGSVMAGVLVDAGHDVSVWNRSSRVLSEKLQTRATVCTDLAEVIDAPVVHSMLSDDAATRAVFTDAVLAQMADGTLHVAHESVTPDTARDASARHAAAGVGFVAAPVIGRPDVAARAALNVLVSGAPDDVARAQETIDALAARVWHYGADPGAACIAKVAVNYTLIHAIEALAESVSIVEAAGLDGGDFVELLTNTLFDGVAYRGYGARIATRTYQPAAFSVRLGLKDLSLAESLAAQVGAALPTASAFRSIFEQALSDPATAELDWSAIAEVVRARGVRSPQ